MAGQALATRTHRWSVHGVRLHDVLPLRLRHDDLADPKALGERDVDRPLVGEAARIVGRASHAESAGRAPHELHLHAVVVAEFARRSGRRRRGQRAGRERLRRRRACCGMSVRTAWQSRERCESNGSVRASSRCGFCAGGASELPAERPECGNSRRERPLAPRVRLPAARVPTCWRRPTGSGARRGSL